MVNITKYDRGDMTKYQVDGSFEDGILKAIQAIGDLHIRIDMPGSKASLFHQGESENVIDISKPYYVVEKINKRLQNKT